MPKVRTSTRSSKQSQALIVLTDGQKRILIPRPKTYEAAIDAVRIHFPQFARNRAKLQTDQLDICEEELTDIAPESWESVVELVSSVFIAQTHECPIENKPMNFWRTKDRGQVIGLQIETAGQQTRVRVKGDTNIKKVLPYIAARLGLDSEGDHFSATFDGFRLVNGDTPDTCQMEDGDTLYVHREQVGGKPVIYLYSPTEMQASVTLTLTPHWSLSAVYPVVPVEPHPSGAGDRILWDVKTHPDGTLTELNTGLDVAYLFWEAHTNHDIPISPPASPVTAQVDGSESFSPLTCELSPKDAVLLPVQDITSYLDKILLALGLHTEARTSFITYWLPSFLKHAHVALRFVSQAVYETAAALEITPVPDVVTRVFMIFKGISDNELDVWAGSKPAAGDEERWKGIVGVDIDRALDSSLFRVLEWGGMEVTSVSVR
ncbi:hypothetical protein FB451DRAFT_1360535 [Mycena latifolia]|nr:hypothetical protein FB451DRAFT_1360535 [Mycena latifolia]